jgi:ElaB/YqjD/DUF883 family membrane-anchored ribosome-binding protein
MADESEPEVIRHQMEAQRAALGHKLETLEHKIVETVQGARDAVAETVQTVKDSVQSSVDSVKDTVSSSVETVKETFDIKRQVDRHPWTMFGGSIALGFAAGWLLNRARAARAPTASWGYAPAPYSGAANYGSPSSSRPREESRAASDFTGTPSPSAAPSSSASASGPAESWVDQLSHTFAPEIQKVKGLAIGALMGVVRDLVAQSVPDQLRPQLNEMMDNVTTKLGGEPVQPQVLDQLLPRRHDDQHNGHCRTTQEELQP